MGLIRLTPGATIGAKWELRRRIGRGGMGEVWLAVHKSLEQEVALKVLDADAFPIDLLEEAQSRFHLEAQLAADLGRRTRHVANVFDHGNDDGLDYLVMELLTGESMEDLLQRDGSVEPARLAELIRQAARGLAIAHADGVIHRDLKPANIFVTVDEEGNTLVKLLDFGIAKARPRRPDSAPPSTHRTRAGVLLGTAAYMSPELARGLAIDTRVDLWALACVAYELLTGQLPFNANSDVELLMNICTTSPIPATERVPTLPKDLDPVFEKAFAREIDDRYADARSFADALARALEPSSPLVTPATGSDSIVNATYVATPPPMPAAIAPRSTKPILLVAAIAGLAVLLALVLLATRKRPPEVAAEPPSKPTPASTSPPTKTVEPTPPASPATAPSPVVVVPSAHGAPLPKTVKTAAPKAPTTSKPVDKGEIF